MHILLTKADKLKRGASQNVLLKVQNQLKDFDEISVQLFSAMKRTGIEVARDKLTSWLSPPETAPDGSATATQGLDT
jgi:GTP-binding protein